MCCDYSRLARNETCPRRHHISERRLPLRQPPAEHPFSLPPEIQNPVRNGWVLLHFGAPISLVYPEQGQIGRASCRERVKISVVAGVVKEKRNARQLK